VLKDKLKNDFNNSQSMIMGSSLLAQSSIFFTANHEYQLALPLIAALEEDIGQVKSVERLYSFAQQRKQNFQSIYG
jgi:hypothetical protein